MLLSFTELLIIFLQQDSAPAHSANTFAKWSAGCDIVGLIVQPTALNLKETLFGIVR